MTKKRLVCLLAMVMLCTVSAALADIAIDAAHFPDPNFRTVVLEEYDRDKDLFLNNEEIEKVESIGVYGKDISDLTGIQYFTSVTFLSCAENRITKLDLSHNPALDDVYCSDNPLTELILNNPALTKLEAENCQISELNAAGAPELKFLNLYNNNPLTEVDVSGNAALESLELRDTGISALNVGSNAALKSLDIRNTNIRSLDVSGCPKLSQLAMDDLPLTYLNISNTRLFYSEYDDEEEEEEEYEDNFYFEVRDFSLSGNKTLKTLVARNCPCLKTVSIFDCVLSSLDVSDNADLKELNACRDQLTELKVSNCPELREVALSENPLTRLDLSGHPKLRSLSFTDTPVTWLDISGSDFDSTELITNLFEMNSSRCGSLETLIARNLRRLDFFYISDYTSEETPYFPKLTSLDLSGSQSLTEISIHASDGAKSLTNLNVDGCTALKSIYCDECAVRELNVSGCPALESLGIANNQLEKLDTKANAKLNRLSCNGNQLKELDVSGNPALQSLNCSGNQLTALNVSGNIALKDLTCHQNPITVVDVTHATALCDIVQKYPRTSGWGEAGDFWIDPDPTDPYIYTVVDGLKVDAGTTVLADNVISRHDETQITLSGSVYLIQNGAATFLKPGNKQITKLIIPDTLNVFKREYPITKIADKACFGYGNLKEVSIGSNVTDMGTATFQNCKKLTKVSIGEKVGKIGKACFSGCVKLQTVSGMAGVTAVGDEAFAKCKALKKYTIGVNVKTIGRKAFGSCVKLAAVAGGKALTTIGERAFEYCSALKEITLESRVSRIGAKAFLKCGKLKVFKIKTTKLKSGNVGSKAFATGAAATFKCPQKKLKVYAKLFPKKGAHKKSKYQKL